MVKTGGGSRGGISSKSSSSKGGRVKLKVKSKTSQGRKIIPGGGPQPQTGPGVTSSALSKDPIFNTLTEVEKTLFKRLTRGESLETIKGRLALLDQPSFKELKPGMEIPAGGISRFDKSGEIFKGTAKQQLQERGLGEGITSEGQQAQIDIAQQQQAQQAALEPEAPEQELSRKEERQENSFLRTFIREKFGEQTLADVEKGVGIAGEIGLAFTPLGPISKVARGTKIVKGAAKIAKAGKSLRVSPIQKLFARERTIVSLQKNVRIGGKPLSRQTAIKAANIYEAEKLTGIRKLLNPFSFKNASLLKKITVVGSIMSVSGATGIASWYAVDNIITGTQVFLRDTAEDVRRGDLSVEEARATFDEHEDMVDTAARFVKVAAVLNPPMWPLAKFYFNGVDQQKLLIEGHRIRMESFGSGEQGGVNVDFNQ